MNNQERELWVLNDQGLYNWFNGSCLSMTNFIKKNKGELDDFISRRLAE